MPSNHLILCCPLLLLPSVFPSIRVFSNESVFHIRWPKSIGASASTSVFPVNTQDWSPLGWTGCLLAVQGTLKSLLQHHSSKASILRHSAFFTVQLSHPYMTTGKTIALTRWTFVGIVMSLLLNMLSRLVITFLPRSKHLLISGCTHHLQLGVVMSKYWFCGSYFSAVTSCICHILFLLYPMPLRGDTN